MAVQTGYGGGGEGSGGQGYGAVLKGLTDAASLYQGQIVARQARRMGRAQIAALRAIVRQMQIDAKVARDRWMLDLSARYPESPVYAPLTAVEFVDVPVRLTTKQTGLQQRLMTDPNNARLAKKLAKVSGNIAAFGARHPGAVTTKLVTRK